jgi:hypothetical protein
VIFPVRYPVQPVENMKNQIEIALKDEKWAGQADALTHFLQQPGISFIYGRALYPRYYANGENEPKTAKTGYAGLNFARLVFSMVGSQDPLVVFPTTQPPSYFPNASDVLMAGCMRTHYFQPVVILVNQGNRPLYLSSGTVPDGCSTISDPPQ